MSTQPDDPLYIVFEQHLHSGLYDDRPADAFVRDVVDYYFVTLTREGHVPHRLHESMRVDLVMDVQDMLRAKIYGHFDIRQYNQARRK